MINLNACHLRDFMKGKLLIVVEIDRNDSMNHIAFVVS